MVEMRLTIRVKGRARARLSQVVYVQWKFYSERKWFGGGVVVVWEAVKTEKELRTHGTQGGHDPRTMFNVSGEPSGLHKEDLDCISELSSSHMPPHYGTANLLEGLPAR